jgi:hypothetical protein
MAARASGTLILLVFLLDIIISPFHQINFVGSTGYRKHSLTRSGENMPFFCRKDLQKQEKFAGAKRKPLPRPGTGVSNARIWKIYQKRAAAGIACCLSADGSV